MKKLVLTLALLGLVAVISLRINKAWGAARENRQRYLRARSNHFDKLRPLLARDAERFEAISATIQEQGYYAPLAEDPPDSDAAWYPQLLIRDFASHFDRFAADREQLREKVLALDTNFRSLLRSVEDQFGLPSELRERSQVMALSTVRLCLGKGAAPTFEETPTSYAFSTGLGGSEYSESHAAPPPLAAAFAAYQRLRPDAGFEKACADLRGRAGPIQEEAHRLSLEAKRLSVADDRVVRGDCPYLPKAR